jgi:hypothetical protein
MALPPLELFSLEKAALLPGGLFVSLEVLGQQPHTSAAGTLLYASRSRSYNPTRYVQREASADVAQLVEQLIRNQQVSGSIPLVGSIPVFPLEVEESSSNRSFPCSCNEFGTAYPLLFSASACGRPSSIRIIASEAEV